MMSFNQPSKELSGLSIKEKLELLIRQQARLNGTCLFLPSVLHLSRQMKCSPLDIYHALQLLAEQGYRSLALHFEGPITISRSRPA